MYLNFPGCYISLSWAFGMPRCISPDFFEREELPSFFYIIWVLEPGADWLGPCSVPRLSQLYPIYVAKNDQQPPTRRVLPEYGMHKATLPASGAAGASGEECVAGNQKGCLYSTTQCWADSPTRSCSYKLKQIPAVDNFREQSLILLKVLYQLVLIVKK